MTYSADTTLINKSLKKIDKSIKTQVFKKIDKILKRPYEIGEAKSQDLKHIRAVHIYGGSYVLLFKVDDKQNIIFFLCLEPHDECYKDTYHKK